MKASKYTLMLMAFLGSTWLMEGREPPEESIKRNYKSGMKALAENCSPATAETDLNINNVRARILAGGDMWWDLSDARYEVPKGSGKHSMFAGSLWLGGFDEAENLKLAAMTYRQTGNDFWTGPLGDDATITAEVCNEYDRHWLVYKDEVATHKAWIECKLNPDCNEGEMFPGYAGRVPQSIREWPGNGIDNNLPYKLAPYFELDTNGTPGLYEWEYDYPGYDFEREYDCQKKEVDLLYGDQTIWWVYNDKGNAHTETGADALGFEIRAQAFAFTSNDEINNMTFNNYRILNRSTFRLSETYFGTWFDPDLGNADDDIIGCDIARGLGYCYNGDAEDEGPTGYGMNPPAVGFDFFQGPFADYYDGLDNDRDGCVDGIMVEGVCVPEDPSTGVNERIIMSGFMYYNNNTTDMGNPSSETHFYNYLTNKWKNNRPLVIENPSGPFNTNNGDGFPASATSPGVTTSFAYPGDSYDTTGAYEPSAELPNGGWWESPNNQEDKRGLHTAGPFSLAPGALNFITTGVVWARNFRSQDPFASVNDVIIADDKAQQLFDNCFQILDGPRSPNVEVVELDRKIILKFTDAFAADVMGYDQIDPAIAAPDDWTPAQVAEAQDTGYFSYRFEGFQIFQVSGPDVSVDNLYDPAQSRLVAQSDIKNNITQLVNFTIDPDLENGALVPQDMTLIANNDGIQLTYEFTEDAFAEGDRRLVNNKEYYYYVVAYSQNQFKVVDPRNLSESSQKEPYLAGRTLGNNQKPYLAIPSKTQMRNDGTVLNAEYGDELPITRLDGAGNGGNFLRITGESENSIVFAPEFVHNEIEYLAGNGPFTVKVVDPLKVKAGTFQVKFLPTSIELQGTTPSNFDSTDVTQAHWQLIDLATGEILDSSEFDISFLGEQLIDEYGISITFLNADAPGESTDPANMNGVIGGEISYNNPEHEWLSGIPDTDGETPFNWILAGTQDASADDPGPYADYPGDAQGFYESILGGTWTPAAYGANVDFDPNSDLFGYSVRRGNYGSMYPVSEIGNVDLVITSDPAKWTRSPVIELGNVAENNEGEQPPFRIRQGTTMDKDGSGGLVPNTQNPVPVGWSYFPGYAINVETGRRLYIAFGEASWLRSENGDDMLWNPSPRAIRSNVDPLLDYAMGGMHVVYIFADSSQTGEDLTYRGDDITQFPLLDELNQMSTGNFRNTQLFFGAMYWIGLPLTVPGYEFETYSEIPTETKVSLRMAKPYQATSLKSPLTPPRPNNGLPLYNFTTEGYQVETGVEEVANEALDLIRVVPNPYNGSSEYEDSQLDNVVKITNLPENCKIRIFMTNGTLIRTINKDNSLTFAEWDLKNDFNVPIASGIYLIHVEVPGVGEKVVKWMGTLRPVDLNAF